MTNQHKPVCASFAVPVGRAANRVFIESVRRTAQQTVGRSSAPNRNGHTSYEASMYRVDDKFCPKT